MTKNDKHYDLKPSKEAYQAVKSDVTPVSAFKELIDNALDNWMRISQRLDDINIEIEYYEGDADTKDKVVIRDDTGGVEEQDVRILFALGQSKKSSVTGSIGAYGIGAKKAIVNLGNTAIIKSRHLHSDTGYGFTIDEDWLRNDDDWSVDKHEYTEIKEGVTEISITDLNIDWDDYVDDLEQNLSQTYEKFLNGHSDTERGDLNIVIKQYDTEDWETPATKQEVTAPTATNWSYAPIDGFHPRRYENIELDSKEFSDTVYMNITVGLMRGSSSATAGVDIYCQDRKVLTAVRDDRAAFGTGAGSNRLGNFTNQHHRLKVIIEFNTEGDASELPWDAQKSDIDPYNRVAQAAYSWIRRIVKPYHKAAGTFEDLPSAFLSPYSHDNEYAVTTDLDDPYDYSGRERVTHKADNDLPEAKTISTRAAVASTLKVFAPGLLPEKHLPAFKSELDRLLNQGEDEEDQVDIESMPRVEDVPSSLDEDEAEQIIEQLTREARSHLRSEQRATDLPSWQQTVYDQILRELLAEDDRDLSMDNLDPIDPDTVTPAATESISPETTSHDDETDDSEGETSTANEDNERTTEAPTTGTDEAEPSPSAAAEEVAEEVVRDLSDDLGDDEETTEKVQQTVQEQVQQFTEPSTADTDGEHLLRLPDDDWAELTDALGLQEDASGDEVREELLSTMEVLRQLRATA